MSLSERTHSSEQNATMRLLWLSSVCGWKAKTNSNIWNCAHYQHRCQHHQYMPIHHFTYNNTMLGLIYTRFFSSVGVYFPHQMQSPTKMNGTNTLLLHNRIHVSRWYLCASAEPRHEKDDIFGKYLSQQLAKNKVRKGGNMHLMAMFHFKSTFRWVTVVCAVVAGFFPGEFEHRAIVKRIKFHVQLVLIAPKLE